MPVNTPLTLIVPTLAVLLLHVPPPVASVSDVVPPRQTVTGTGAIAAGVALMVNIAVV